MKAIVIGTSASGKTTLIRYLRAHAELPVEEIDEHLVTENGGQYPSDATYKNEILVPAVIKKVLDRERIVFFTNTDYFSREDLRAARARGFVVIQLAVGMDELQRRNSQRVKDEGYEDAGAWLSGMLRYQEEMREAGLVDHVIDATRPTEKAAEEFARILSRSDS